MSSNVCSAHPTLPLMIALLGACGGAAASGSSAATSPSNDEGPAPDGTAVLRLTQAELDERLASGALRRWHGEQRGERQPQGPFRGGLVAVDGGIRYSECVPGGGGYAFFVDAQGHVYAQSTYYRYAPKDRRGQPMPTPAIRCFSAEVTLAQGEAFAGTIELVAP
jgi:hypothetical protein